MNKFALSSDHRVCRDALRACLCVWVSLSRDDEFNDANKIRWKYLRTFLYVYVRTYVCVCVCVCECSSSVRTQNVFSDTHTHSDTHANLNANTICLPKCAPVVWVWLLIPPVVATLLPTLRAQLTCTHSHSSSRLTRCHLLALALMVYTYSYERMVYTHWKTSPSTRNNNMMLLSAQRTAIVSYQRTRCMRWC